MSQKKVALVTGSNKGIGFAIVRRLCHKFDGDVVLCSRDENRGREAVAQLEEEGLKPKLLRLAIDEPESVTAARDWLVGNYGGLDVLVNNAAIAYIDESVKSRSEIVCETLAVNYYATASVCDILFPILRPGARVVNVSSSAGMVTRLQSPELRARISSPTLTRSEIQTMADEYIRDVDAGVDHEKGWPAQKMYDIYSVSKVFLSALTWIQHRELLADERADMVINAVHPGYVDTDMTRHEGVITIDEGAVAAVDCCLVPPGGQPRGQMVWFNSEVVDWINDNIPPTEPAPKKPAPQ